MPKILIVEDDTFLQGLTVTRLKKDGYELEVAGTGTEATKKLTDEQFDLVLLDLMLPDKSGFDVLKEMRSAGRHMNTPVVVFSNLADNEEVKKALDYGANEYMIKANFTLDEVAEKVKENLK